MSTWDAFISHASEDKDAFVRNLAIELRRMGFSIWYDEFTLRVGDRLRYSIDQGLRESQFGIVILSPQFFAKKWPQDELDALVTKEVAGRDVILPVWLNVTAQEVASYSLVLASRYAALASQGMANVLAQLANVLREASTDRSYKDRLTDVLSHLLRHEPSFLKHCETHLYNANRAGYVRVKPEGDSYYSAADTLCKYGALEEVPDSVTRSPGSRHRSRRHFKLTPFGLSLLHEIRAKKLVS